LLAQSLRKTSEETQRLLICLSEGHDQFAAEAILLLLLTGARRSEITQAKWENVDLRKRTLLVPRSKSGKPRRIILNDHALAVFRSIQRTRGNPFVFPLPSTGRPPTSLFRQWHRIRCKAGLPDLRLHDLRHSFASFLVNKGVSLYVVQGLLGHSQIRTTQRYAHLNQQTLQDAVEVVGQYLPRTESGHSFEEVGGENVLKTEQDSELVTAWSRRADDDNDGRKHFSE
jgi:integrase